MNVPKFETNLFESFSRVKSDILKLNSDLSKISTALAHVVDDNDGIKKQIATINSKLKELDKCKTDLTTMKIKAASKPKKIVVEKAKKVKHRAKVFIASKTGKKFHVKNCIFAKNIKPKSAVKFKSKDAMLNQGYKPCSCVK